MIRWNLQKCLEIFLERINKNFIVCSLSLSFLSVWIPFDITYEFNISCYVWAVISTLLNCLSFSANRWSAHALHTSACIHTGPWFSRTSHQTPCLHPILYFMINFSLALQTRCFRRLQSWFYGKEITALHERSFLALSRNRGVVTLDLCRWGPNSQFKHERKKKEQWLCTGKFYRFIFVFFLFRNENGKNIMNANESMYFLIWASNSSACEHQKGEGDGQKGSEKKNREILDKQCE